MIDRCENCGLAVARDAVPDAEDAIAELLGASGNGRHVFRAPNAVKPPGLARGRELGRPAPGRRRR